MLHSLLLSKGGPRQPSRERPVLAGLVWILWISVCSGRPVLLEIVLAPATHGFAPSGTSGSPYQDWPIRSIEPCVWYLVPAARLELALLLIFLLLGRLE